MLSRTTGFIKKLTTAALLAGATVSSYAAQTLAQVATAVTNNFAAVTNLITGAAYVGGTGMFLVAIFQFRQHKENPTQVPLSKPMMFLAIAAALVFLPSLIGVSGQTIFGVTSVGGASGFQPGAGA
jgi:intracellular multiplication protein IcmD